MDKTKVIIKSSAVEIGTELNQTYRIDKLIGVGGMGEVFKGHNIQTGDPVAIKVVLPEFARDEMIFELFRKEARVLNHLNHDAIVRYYVFSLDRVIGRPYLAMEYVDGQSLAAQIKETPLAPESFFGLLWRLSDGLYKAHEAGVIHRDISPDNVILPDGLVEKAKIIDFGIARSANVGGGTLLGGGFAGKYNYVSPEQLGLFGGDVTPKSDIYSLGLMMAAALRGKPLDMSGSQVEVIEKRRSVPQLSGVGIPKQFHPILTAMLQPDPADRPESMAAVRDWQDGGTTKATGARKPAKSSSGVPVQGAGSPRAGGANAQTFRNLTIGIGLAAVLGIGGFAGWSYLQKQKPTDTKPAVEQTAQANSNTTAPATDTKLQGVTATEVPPAKDTERLPESADQPVQQSGQVVQPPIDSKPQETTPAAQVETSTKVPEPTMSQATISQPTTTENSTPTATEPIVQPKSADTQVAMVPGVPKSGAKSDQPQVGTDLVALRGYLQKFGEDACFRGSIDASTASSAELSVLSSPESLTRFKSAFVEKTGFVPQIKFDELAQPQCGFIGSLNKIKPKNATPLKIALDRTELRGNNADTGVAGDPLKITVTGVADRNVYLFVVDHDGGIQNINRACPSCLTLKDGQMNAGLSLFSPPNVDAANAPPFYPMLVFVAAASRPLNGINGQDAFDAVDFDAPLLKDAASADDFSMQLAYVKLKAQ